MFLKTDTPEHDRFLCFFNSPARSTVQFFVLSKQLCSAQQLVSNTEHLCHTKASLQIFNRIFSAV